MYIALLAIKLVQLVVHAVKPTSQLSLYTKPDVVQYVTTICNYYAIKIPTVYTTTLSVSPYTKGLLHKIIVLPICIITQLTEQELAAVLLHEIAHIKRNDHATNVIISICKVVLCFNPFARQLLQQLQLQRELACDDWVLTQNVEKIHYATALQKAAVLQYNNNTALAFTTVPHQLHYRITRLFGQHKKQQFSFKYLLLLVALPLLLLQQIHFGEALPKKIGVTNLPITQLAIVAKLPTTNNYKALVPNKLQPTTTPKTPLVTPITDVVLVSNNATSQLNKTIIQTRTTTINDAILQLTDSVQLYDANLTTVNINTATNSLLQQILEVSSTVTEPNTVALVSQPSSIIVTNDGVPNWYYNKVIVNQVALYNETLQQWYVTYEIVNGSTLLAKRFVVIKLIKKLASVTL